jgi:hypothetical protein
MSKADKLSQVTEVVAKKMATLYDGNHETQRAVFEAITAQKAAERGESPEQTVSFLTSLLNLGAALNEEERANAHSSNKTVEIKAIETSIEQNLAASGKSPEERAMALGVLKNIGTLMAGGGISQGDDRGVTAPHTPAVAKDTTPLPDH